MESVSIRGLRGAVLQESARKGEPLAITNHRVLVGVLIPAAAGWVEHLIYHNWSQVRQDITEAEEAMAGGASMTTIQHMVPESDGTGYGEPGPDRPETPVVSLAAAVVGETVAQDPASRETVEQLQAALNPVEPSVVRTVRTIRIGDLSATRIEEAGAAGQALAVTHDRELIGILIPVTQGLVQFLIEQNIASVMHHISQGEKQLKAEKMTTLGQLIPPGSARPGFP